MNCARKTLRDWVPWSSRMARGAIWSHSTPCLTRLRILSGRPRKRRSALSSRRTTDMILESGVDVETSNLVRFHSLRTPLRETPNWRAVICKKRLWLKACELTCTA